MTEPSASQPGKHPVAAKRTLRAIAAFEGIKGLAALVAMAGLIDLAHRDVRGLAEALIGRLRFNPAGHYSSLIRHYADAIPGMNLHSIMLLGAAYVAIRFAEAYGLWRDKAWAEWLAAFSGALYVPFELQHLIEHPSWISAGVLAGNIIVVLFMAAQLVARRRHAHGMLGD